MGQTLTHGVYLPNEGERNCYNGLASNWRLLDGAIGTVAAHTTAIAGKADISHAHGNISNDGKIGTTANVPLITGTGGVVQAGAFGNSANTFCEGNDSRLSDARTPVAHTHGKADITDLFNSANTWSGQNTFSDHTYIYGQWKGLYFKNPEATAGVSPSGDKRNYIEFLDSNDYTLGQIILNVIGANSTWIQMGVFAKDVNDSSQSIYCGTQYCVYGNGEKYFNPSTIGDVHLGTSIFKWKTLNGVNPGALSLPSKVYTGAIAITEIDRTGWVYDGTVNTYSPPVDCWLSISNGGSITVWGSNTAFGMKATDNIAIPLRQGETYNISLTNTPDFCRIYPCTGNV